MINVALNQTLFLLLMCGFPTLSRQSKKCLLQLIIYTQSIDLTRVWCEWYLICTLQCLKYHTELQSTEKFCNYLNIGRNITCLMKFVEDEEYVIWNWCHSFTNVCITLPLDSSSCSENPRNGVASLYYKDPMLTACSLFSYHDNLEVGGHPLGAEQDVFKGWKENEEIRFVHPRWEWTVRPQLGPSLTPCLLSHAKCIAADWIADSTSQRFNKHSDCDSCSENIVTNKMLLRQPDTCFLKTWSVILCVLWL